MRAHAMTPEQPHRAIAGYIFEKDGINFQLIRHRKRRGYEMHKRLSKLMFFRCKKNS
jgi:hypothetical protein